MCEPEVIKQSIWESAKETFETMIFLPFGDPEAQPVPANSPSLIGAITFTGQVQGAFSILCRREGAEKIARSMLMSEPDDAVEPADICDAFGELTNLVIGGIKSRINKVVTDMQISIPSVTEGLEIQPFPHKHMTRVDVEANTDGEPVQMTMIYKMN